MWWKIFELMGKKSLVQKTLFKWGEKDFLSGLGIPLIGGRLNNYFDFKSEESFDLKTFY
jgi:hypothetical protein